MTASMVVSWSGVSSYGKLASSASCHGVSASHWNPATTDRAAYKAINSPASCSVARLALAFARLHSCVPSRVSLG